MPTQADFFSCDWGTTSFRLRRVRAQTGEVLAERRECMGVRTLSSQAPPGDLQAREKLFADFLRDQLSLLAGGNRASLDGAGVVISGMASSSVGWREVPYTRAPVELDGSSIRRQRLELDMGENARVHVQLISGVRTDHDILRGEESELLGLFADGHFASLAENVLVVLPGTHSKHVRIKRRQLTTFQTYLTGELFEILSTQSLLRASVQAAAAPAAIWSEPRARVAFAEGVRHAADSGLAAALFRTRVRTVLDAVPPEVNRWFLSGILIGAEVMDLAQNKFTGSILLAAPDGLSAPYQVALESVGLGSRVTIMEPAEVACASVLGHRVLLQNRGPRAS